jgi:hypothetical protein
MINNTLIRERIARTAIINQVGQLLTLRAAWIAATGGMPGVEGSMAKIYASEEYQKVVGWFQQMAGAEGLLSFGADSDVSLTHVADTGLLPSIKALRAALSVTKILNITVFLSGATVPIVFDTFATFDLSAIPASDCIKPINFSKAPSFNFPTTKISFILTSYFIILKNFP